MTYLFIFGRIQVFNIEISYSMKYEEYNEKSTAKMVGEVFMKSPALSKEAVATKFRHGT